MCRDYFQRKDIQLLLIRTTPSTSSMTSSSWTPVSLPLIYTSEAILVSRLYETQRWGRQPSGGHQPIIFLPEKCMKLKKNIVPGGGVSTWNPLRSIKRFWIWPLCTSIRWPIRWPLESPLVLHQLSNLPGPRRVLGPGGVLPGPQEGAWSQRGGGCLVPGRGACLVPGGGWYPSMHWDRPPREQNDWQTGVKT